MHPYNYCLFSLPVPLDSQNESHSLVNASLHYCNSNSVCLNVFVCAAYQLKIDLVVHVHAIYYNKSLDLKQQARQGATCNSC